MSTAGKNLLIEHRVKALANVFLMGRNSIATYPLADFGEVDLLARYLPEGEEQEKLFGVILKGTSNPLSLEQDAALFLNQWARTRKHRQYLPFPVLVLLFSMVDDEGYYAWRLEPVVSADDSYLKVNRTFQVGRTTRKGLDALTREIDAWYQMQSRHFLT